MAWSTEGRKTNPAAGALLAKSPPLGEGTHPFNVIATATVLATLRVRHMDADGVTVIESHDLKIPINNSIEVGSGPGTFVYFTSADEFFDVIVVDGIALGQVQASIFT